ncbi:MAG: hypothetical protein JWM19_4191, partial [Actinomycetia bacterium]|nr:hypothetical protein [Actinomycetes bacterium]
DAAGAGGAAACGASAAAVTARAGAAAWKARTGAVPAAGAAVATVIAVTGSPPQQPATGDAAPCIRNSPASTAHSTTARACQDAPGRAARRRGRKSPPCRLRGK